MNTTELQELLDNTIKTITENGCYVKDNKVIENKEVYAISIEGTFYDEYMGDSDWRYREVSGDIIITETQANKLINQIQDCMDVDDEQLLIEASEILNNILKKEDSSFSMLYCTECAEFNNVNKSNSSIWFSDESEDRWELKFYISKKASKDIIKFNIDEKFGCV